MIRLRWISAMHPSAKARPRYSRRLI